MICTYIKGASAGEYGTSHKIFVSNFVLQANLIGKIRFLISNPSSNGVSLRISVKGFGSDISNTFFTGERYFGWGEIENAFKITSGNEKTAAASTEEIINDANLMEP